nr:FAM200A-like protein [Biomphalaria glabrata]
MIGYVFALDALNGGTAEDYEQHITSTVDNLAHLYADCKKLDYESCRETIIKNISNTMSDRAAVNYPTIRIVCDIWQKPLNELKCNLHPLDTIASRCKTELKTMETEMR